MNRFLKKMRRGSGELIAFSVVALLICTLFLYFVAFLSFSRASAEITKAVTVAARCASISESMDDAKKKSLNAAKAAVTNPNVKSIGVDIDYLKDKDWNSGHPIKVTVSADINTLSPYFLSGRQSRSLVVTIEEETLNIELGSVSASAESVYAALRGLGFNRAASCAIMANIQAESGFNPGAVSSDGYNSYGICQWTGGRKTNLMNWCRSRGLDYSTVSAQLQFMKYELQTSYSGVYSTLMNTADNEQGAYNSAYYWTVHYEVPQDKYNRAVVRGRSAMAFYRRYIDR
jgi:hypothetical protein